MRNSTTKGITTERFQLDRFLEVFPDAPIGEITKTIHPDFVISNNNSSIGVEITQLFKSNQNNNFAPREIEAFRELIVQLAKDIYIHKYDIPLDVGVLFSERKLTNSDTSARKLVNIVEKIASGNEPLRIVSADEIDMPTEFSLIKVIKTTSHSSCSWSVSQSGWLSNLDESTIQTAISKKNMKICHYRKRTNEIWLLLVIDQIYLSSSFAVPNTVISYIYDSVFNKTILFSCIDKKWWILNAKRLSNPTHHG